MPGLDNANPIVFRPAQHSIRKEKSSKFDLWTDGALDEDAETLEQETNDPIDEQEVFGVS
jgi:hypothetical protein